MAADREVIREFLVALGYHVDGISARKFTDSLAAVSKTAAKAAAVIAAVGVAAEHMVKKFASNMERLFYISQRNKASVSNIQALEFAFSQVGLSAEDGASAIESFGAALRTQPGLVAFIKNLGVATEGRDTIEVLLDTVEQLAKLPHFAGAKWAEMFGIDEKTFTNLKNNLPKLRAAITERKEMEKQSGIDAQAGAAASAEYMNSLRRLWEQVEVLSQAFAVKLLPYFRDFNEAALYGLQNLQKLIKSGFSTELGEWGVHLKGISRELMTIAGYIERTWNMIGGPDATKGAFTRMANGLKTAAKMYLDYSEGMLALLSGNWAGAKAAFGRMLGGAPEAIADAVTNTTRDTRPAWVREGRLPNEREIHSMMPEWMGGTRTAPPAVAGAPPATLPPAPAVASPSQPRGSLPLGMQQNNPGNLRSWGSAPVSRGFAVFQSAQQGLSALAGNMLAYARAGYDNVRTIINRYAPPSENDTGSYIGAVASRLGVDPDQKLNLNDANTLARLMAAIVQHEQGYQPFGTNDYFGAAASRGVVLNQRTEINVSGADAASTGRAVASEQGRVNSDLLRNFAGVTR